MRLRQIESRAEQIFVVTFFLNIWVGDRNIYCEGAQKVESDSNIFVFKSLQVDRGLGHVSTVFFITGSSPFALIHGENCFPRRISLLIAFLPTPKSRAPLNLLDMHCPEFPVYNCPQTVINSDYPPGNLRPLRHAVRILKILLQSFGS